MDEEEFLEAAYVNLDESAEAAAESVGALTSEVSRNAEETLKASETYRISSNKIGGQLSRAFDRLIHDGDRLSDVLGKLGKSISETVFRKSIEPVTDHIGGGIANVLNGFLGFAGSGGGGGGDSAQGSTKARLGIDQEAHAARHRQPIADKARLEVGPTSGIHNTLHTFAQVEPVLKDRQAPSGPGLPTVREQVQSFTDIGPLTLPKVIHAAQVPTAVSDHVSPLIGSTPTAQQRLPAEGPGAFDIQKRLSSFQDVGPVSSSQSSFEEPDTKARARALSERVASFTEIGPLTPASTSLATSDRGIVRDRVAPFADARDFVAHRVLPFAQGGQVSAPASYLLRGDGAGLAQDYGAATLRRERGGDTTAQGRHAGSDRPINVVMNIQTSDVEGFRRSQSQIAAQMSRVLARGQRNR